VKKKKDYRRLYESLKRRHQQGKRRQKQRIQRHRHELEIALEQVKRRLQSIKEEEARLEGLLSRNDALKSQIAPKEIGRPTRWKGSFGRETVLIVEAMRRQQGVSIAAALRLLRKGPPWNELRRRDGRPYSDEQSQTRYQEALKYWAPLLKKDKEIDDAMAENRVDDRPFPDVRRLVREG